AGRDLGADPVLRLALDGHAVHVDVHLGALARRDARGQRLGDAIGVGPVDDGELGPARDLARPVHGCGRFAHAGSSISPPPPGTPGTASRSRSGTMLSTSAAMVVSNRCPRPTGPAMAATVEGSMPGSSTAAHSAWLVRALCPPARYPVGERRWARPRWP